MRANEKVGFHPVFNLSRISFDEMQKGIAIEKPPILWKTNLPASSAGWQHVGVDDSPLQ